MGTDPSVYPGRSLSLKCVAFGNPNALIRWTLPSGTQISAGQQADSSGRVSVGDEGTLTVDSITRDDLGTYTCAARNVAGETRRSSEVTVTTEEPPTVTVVTTQATTTLPSITMTTAPIDVSGSDVPIDVSGSGTSPTPTPCKSLAYVVLWLLVLTCVYVFRPCRMQVCVVLDTS